MDQRQLLQLTADIVAAHASMNELSPEGLLAEIRNVYKTLASLAPGLHIADEEEVQAPVEHVPVVPLAAAFGAEKVFCMVCGKGMKTLKRHLSTAHGMKPGDYRKTFAIPPGTPLVAKNYSDARKKMAQDLNLADRLIKARASRKKKKV